MNLLTIHPRASSCWVGSLDWRGLHRLSLSECGATSWRNASPVTNGAARADTSWSWTFRISVSQGHLQLQSLPTINSPSFQTTFDYRSVLGKIICLSSNTGYDLAIANHQCANFASNPQSPHRIAIKQIGRCHFGAQSSLAQNMSSHLWGLQLYGQANYNQKKPYPQWKWNI
jgi:hypothetical protein